MKNIFVSYCQKDSVYADNKTYEQKEQMKSELINDFGYDD